MSRNTRGCMLQRGALGPGQYTGRSSAPISMVSCEVAAAGAAAVMEASWKKRRVEENGGSDRGEPVRVLGIAPADQVEERRLQFFGDRPAPARADLAVVDFADGCDFGGGAREEGFVGDVDVVARQALGDHGNAQV